MNKQELVMMAPEEQASFPYARPRLTVGKLLLQYRIVMMSHLAEYRFEWILHIMSGLILPIGLIYFAKALGGGTFNKDQAIFFLGGNMAISIVFGPTTFLISKLGAAKQTREFSYWIMLPLPKVILILALISVSVIFALPSLLGTYLVGNLMLGLPFSGLWTLIFLIPLGVLPLSSLGALLGSYMPNAQAANSVGNILAAFISFLSPLMIPPQVLPIPFRILSWFMPTTYVADAFRIVLSGHLSQQLWIDVTILAVCSIVFLSIVQWKIDWRVS